MEEMEEEGEEGEKVFLGLQSIVVLRNHVGSSTVHYTPDDDEDVDVGAHVATTVVGLCSVE